jgi:hypothetical protein
MNEKSEAELNKMDMQAVIAAWIVANGGCGSSSDVHCSGDGGIFKGTECPALYCHGICSAGCLDSVRQWLEKYHQEKAEDAEAEKRKAEAAKKEEQHGREKSASCGNCANFSLWSSDFGEDMKTSRCVKKGSHVPCGFTGCPDFEPRAKAKRDDEDECHADAMIYNGILISTPSQEDKLRHKAWLLEIENSHRLNDIERLKAEAAKRTTDDAERISRLEKDVSEAQELRDKAIEKYSGLADKYTDLADKCERLTEQRNRLSNSLIEAMRRAKEVESRDNILAQKIVDSVARSNRLSDLCSEKDGLIDRLRRDVANLLTDRSIMEGKMQLYVSPFR